MLGAAGRDKVFQVLASAVGGRLSNRIAAQSFYEHASIEQAKTALRVTTLRLRDALVLGALCSSGLLLAHAGPHAGTPSQRRYPGKRRITSNLGSEAPH